MASDLIEELMGKLKDDEAFRLASQVSALEDKLLSAGIDPGDAAPRESFLSATLDTLNAPMQGVLGVVDTAIRGDAFSPGVGLGWSRGQDENVTTEDILRRHDIVDDPVLRGTLGIVGNIAADPFTYLSFGAGNVAKIGGRAITKEAGSALANKVSERIVASGVDDFVRAEELLDSAFKAAGDYSDITKELQKLIANNASETVIELQKARQAQALGRMQLTEKVTDETGRELSEKVTKLIDPSEVTDDIFEKKAIRIGASIPFLGNFTTPETAKAAETFFNDPGPISKFMRTLGEAWTPARFETKIEINDKTLDVLRGANDWAKENLVSLMSAVEKLPGMSKPIEAAKDIGSRAYDSFQRIFNQKYFLGERNWDMAKHLNREKAGNSKSALGVLKNTFTKEELLDSQAQTDAFLAIDNAVRQTALSRLNPNAVSQLGKRPEEVLARIANVGNVDEDDIALFQRLFDADTEKMAFSSAADVLSSGSLSERARSIGLKALNLMQDTAAADRAMGLNYNEVALYLPHRFQNIFDSASGVRQSKDAFFKKRKYETAQQAFQDAGHVADTSLGDILYKRLKFSLDKRAERAYWNRLVTENSLPLEQVQKLYKEAAINPGGDAAKLLRSLRVNVDPVDVDLINKGATDAVRANILRKSTDGTFDSSRYGGSSAESLLALKEDEFAAKVHEDMLKAGELPLDRHIAQRFRGEVAEVVKEGKKEFFLPESLARAWKENTASKDLAKSGAFSSLVPLLDTANKFFKTLSTRPWPGYWAQNYFGDRFLQAMQGVEAMSPGLMARTHDVLSGKSAMKLRSGFLDKRGLENILSKFEPGFTMDEFQGVIDSASKLDVEALYGAKGGSWAKAKSVLSKAEQGLRKNFDQFYRVNHLLHRLEKGDSLQEAVTAAKNAYLDYSNLSPVERSYFNRFFMFYGFMSQATKRAVNSLITRPGDITLQSHIVNGISEFFSSPDAAPTAEEFDNRLMNSQVMNEQLSRYLGKDEKGRPMYGRGFGAPLNAIMQQFPVTLPRSVSVGEIQDTIIDNFDAVIKRQFATANPLIKAAAERISGKSLYFDAPLSSEFLRRVPSLNKQAQRLLGVPYNDLPVDLDAATKLFLRAVPNEKGSLTADPGMMWLLANVVPGLSRAISTANAATNPDVPVWAKALRIGTGVNIENSDPTRSVLMKRKLALQQEIKDRSVNDILGIQSGEIDLNAD